jgi:acetyl esterase/lipase
LVPISGAIRPPNDERELFVTPVASEADPFAALAGRLRTMPIWIFHGAKDDVVPLERSQEMVEALRAAGGDVRFTVYPEAKHDSWTATYANPELYTWLLAHRRGDGGLTDCWQARSGCRASGQFGGLTSDAARSASETTVRT